MANQIQRSTKEGAFISARILRTRLVSEQITTAPARASKEPMPVQLRIDASCGFSVGLDDVVKPRNLSIGIEYKVSLKIEGTNKQYAAYEANHETQFELDAWSGFDDWSDLPPSAMAPYLAMVQDIAMRRAEGALPDIGLRGVILPTPPVGEASFSRVKTEVTVPEIVKIATPEK